MNVKAHTFLTVLLTTKKNTGVISELPKGNKIPCPHS